MSDPESFVARWSRKKREAEQQGTRATQAATDAERTNALPEAVGARDQGGEAGRATAAKIGAPETPAFDIASLPPLESITATSDIRAFLAPGVPAELTRAALRRAWSADPKIRDFVGMADYDWDFNTPGVIAGFGPLEMTDELRREVLRMVGRSLGGDVGAEEPDRPAPTSTAEQGGQSSIESSSESAAATDATPIREAQSNDGASQDDPISNQNELHNSEAYLQRPQENIAAQYHPDKSDNVQLIVKRFHGRALPK